MSDPSDWFRAKRVWGTPGGPGKFHVTDLSSTLEWSVEYSERPPKLQTETNKYSFKTPVCLNANVEPGECTWDIHEVCRQMLEKETNPPEPTIIDTITVESENGPMELKVATNLKPVKATTNMYTITDSTEPAVERNQWKSFEFIASEDVAQFIETHGGSRMISAIISDSREFKLWLEKGKPPESPKTLCTLQEFQERLKEAKEEWDPCQEQDDQVWELQNELAYTRRELRRTENDRNGWRRLSLMTCVCVMIQVIMDVASYFLNN